MLGTGIANLVDLCVSYVSLFCVLMLVYNIYCLSRTNNKSKHGCITNVLVSSLDNNKTLNIFLTPSKQTVKHVTVKKRHVLEPLTTLKGSVEC